MLKKRKTAATFYRLTTLMVKKTHVMMMIIRVNKNYIVFRFQVKKTNYLWRGAKRDETM